MEEADMSSKTRGSRENPIRSACVIIPRGGKFSAIHHAKRLQVEIAGGKQDEGETIEECALREAREELGVEVFNLRPLYTYLGESITGVFYFCTVFRADIRPEDDLKSSTEGVAFWATREELLAGRRARTHQLAIIMIEDDIHGGLVDW